MTANDHRIHEAEGRAALAEARVAEVDRALLACQERVAELERVLADERAESAEAIRRLERWLDKDGETAKALAEERAHADRLVRQVRVTYGIIHAGLHGGRAIDREHQEQCQMPSCRNARAALAEHDARRGTSS